MKSASVIASELHAIRPPGTTGLGPTPIRDGRIGVPSVQMAQLCPGIVADLNQPVLYWSALPSGDDPGQDASPTQEWPGSGEEGSAGSLSDFPCRTVCSGRRSALPRPVGKASHVHSPNWFELPESCCSRASPDLCPRHRPHRELRIHAQPRRANQVVSCGMRTIDGQGSNGSVTILKALGLVGPAQRK